MSIKFFKDLHFQFSSTSKISFRLDLKFRLVKELITKKLIFPSFRIFTNVIVNFQCLKLY